MAESESGASSNPVVRLTQQPRAWVAHVTRLSQRPISEAKPQPGQVRGIAKGAVKSLKVG